MVGALLIAVVLALPGGLSSIADAILPSRSRNRGGK